MGSIGDDNAVLGAEEVEEGVEAMAGVQEDDELEQMKAQLAEMEKEKAKLDELKEKAQMDAGMAPAGGAGGTGASEAAKEEVDGRSVYIGNVDYGCTPEELQAHFQECGTVNRVTILTDATGNPKGFAYIEFLESDAVESACLMDGSELRGRSLKVQPKRTNVPGMRVRGRGRGRGRGGRGGFFPMPMMPPFMFGYGYGYPMGGGGRGRGRGRGRGGGGGGGGGGYAPY